MEEEEEEEISIYLPEIKKARYPSHFGGKRHWVDADDILPPEVVDEFLLDLWTRSTSKVPPYVRQYFAPLKNWMPEGAFVNNGKKKKKKRRKAK